MDADSCPVKVEVYRAARRRGLPVTLVANRAFPVPGWVELRVPPDPHRPQAADDHIVGAAASGDLVVTDDLRLARRCLARGVVALGTRGRVFRVGSVERAVAVRDLRVRLRARGVDTGGPSRFGRRDRSRFRRALAALLGQPSSGRSGSSPTGATTTRFRPSSFA